MDVEHLGRIAIVEPDPVAAEVVVRQAAKLRRTQLCSNANEARRLLEQNVRLTALIIEYALPDDDGTRVLFAFRRAYPRLPILMLTAVTKPRVINRCQLLRAEFVAKPARRRNLDSFLRRAVAYEHVPDRRVAQVVEDVVQLCSLSARETDVLAAAIDGTPRRTLADQIGTTENTLKSCIKGLLRKCGASSLEELSRRIWKEALAGSDTDGNLRADVSRDSSPEIHPLTIPPPSSKPSF